MHSISQSSDFTAGLDVLVRKQKCMPLAGLKPTCIRLSLSIGSVNDTET
jgi:hypothetical protein